MADLASRIIAAMRSHGYSVATGPDEMNIVYVEGMGPDGSVNDDAPNKFNDARFLIKLVGGQPVIAGAWEATTSPGKYWVTHRMNPKGAAHIAFGQYTAWKVGVHNGSHEALVQTGGPVTVYRDDNEDYKRDGDATDTGYFGINQHWGYDLPRDDLGTSSAGCLVGRTKAGHREFMRLVKSDPRYLRDPGGFTFSAAILSAAEVAGAATAPAPAPTIRSGGRLISQAAIDLIVSEEVTSKAVYESKYRRPEWPGGASGLTIGIGYDVGAGVSTKAQLWADWKGLIPDNMILRLEPAIGVTGQRAASLTAEIRNSVDVPWNAAMAVFEKVDVPRWYARCAKVLPNFDDLSLDCKGALLSLAYNRGASFDNDGDRYREMRAIKAHMAARAYSKIPAELRSMKRLWVGKGLDGLLARREREAALFENGLKPGAAKTAPAPTTTKPAPIPGGKTGILAAAAAAILAAIGWFGAHPVWAAAIGILTAVFIIGGIELYNRRKS